MPPDTTPTRLFAEAQHAHRAGHLERAAQHYRALLAQVPDHADALHLLGLLTSQQGHHAEAARYIQQAIALAPQRPDFSTNLGEVQRRQGRLDQAVVSYRRALQIAPDFAEAHYNLANVLKQQDDLPAAIHHYQHAVHVKPGYTSAHYNLGNALLEYSDYAAAIRAYEQTLALSPDFAEAHNNLGSALHERGDTEAALASLSRAIHLKPDFPNAYRNMTSILAKHDRVDEARQMYQRLLELEPGNPLTRLALESLCPLIASSSAEIDAYRARLMTVLDALAEEPLQPDVSQLHIANAHPPFILSYHGTNDRPIKEQWAALFARPGLLPFTERPARPCSRGKPHVGFVVTRNHEGVFLKCMRGIINRLSGDQFRLTIVCSGERGKQIIRQQISNPAVNYLTLPSRIDRAATLIDRAAFDLLYYWEVGSDALNYFLSFCRLAPVQCTGWGWPVTSGIPTIDSFISSDLLETDTSQDYYTETLVRLPTLPTCYQRPDVPATLKPRSHFGFDESQHLSMSIQNPRKFHPDFDHVLADILRRDPHGLLVVGGGESNYLFALLQQRWQHTIPDVAERMRVMPWMPSREEYMNLLAVADVTLDPFGHGGTNTFYDSIAVGTPVITLPTPFTRSRYAAAGNRLMGLTECNATTPDEYVAAALRFGSDRAERAAISARIAEASAVLFEDINAVHELAGFFEYALETACNQ
jgi:predicted O-linked N-acetylglucosamine transferase (SPINDLY family)